MRNRHFIAISAFVCVCALVTGCSDESTTSEKDSGGAGTADASGASEDATAATDSGSSSGGGSSGASSGGASSSSSSGGGSSSGADAGAKKADCEDTLACHLGCKSDDKACKDACDAKASAAAKTDHDAFSACAVSLCKDVTEGNAAEVACAFDKCSDKLDKCANFGQGENTGEDTLQCLSGCVLGDLGCAVTCLQNADEKAVSGAKAAKACIDSHCLAAPDGKLEQCIKDKCTKAILAAAGGAASTCKQLNQCRAHCPESLKIAKNYCAPTCSAMASAKAQMQDAAYAGCKESKCKADQNPAVCWSNKCETEQEACYGAGGDKTCQEIVNCVVKDCESVGTVDKVCVSKCLATGKAWAQDAFVNLEGCFVRNLKSKEAKTAKCAYPYDQDTCVNVIVGTFCSNQAKNCFTSQ